MRYAWVLGLMFFAAAACGNPCDDLAEKICSCEENDAREDACLTGVEQDQSGNEPSDAEEDRCAELVETCTCNALACGDWAACGLANDPGIDLGPQTCE